MYKDLWNSHRRHQNRYICTTMHRHTTVALAQLVRAAGALVAPAPLPHPPASGIKTRTARPASKVRGHHRVWEEAVGAEVKAATRRGRRRGARHSTSRPIASCSRTTRVTSPPSWTSTSRAPSPAPPPPPRPPVRTQSLHLLPPKNLHLCQRETSLLRFGIAITKGV